MSDRLMALDRQSEAMDMRREFHTCSKREPGPVPGTEARVRCAKWPINLSRAWPTQLEVSSSGGRRWNSRMGRREGIFFFVGLGLRETDKP